MGREVVFENLRKYFLFFIMYAVVGWIYEVLLEVAIYQWGFSNRGVLFGPYLPIYGFGGVIFVLLFYKLSKRRDSTWFRLVAVVMIFLGSALVATTIELATSYLLEYLTGAWPWQTYTNYKINFQGRIALSPSIRFGIGGVFFVYVLQPFYDKILGRFSKKTIAIVSYILMGVIIVDLFFTVR